MAVRVYDHLTAPRVGRRNSYATFSRNEKKTLEFLYLFLCPALMRSATRASPPFSSNRLRIYTIRSSVHSFAGFSLLVLRLSFLGHPVPIDNSQHQTISQSITILSFSRSRPFAVQLPLLAYPYLNSIRPSHTRHCTSDMLSRE